MPDWTLRCPYAGRTTQMNHKTTTLAAAGALVTLLTMPLGATAIPASIPEEPDDAAERYWSIVGQPIRERLAPLVAAASASAVDASTFDGILDQLEEAEETLVDQLSAEQEDGVQDAWKLFAVAEACNGRGACGGSYTEVDGNKISESNYVAEGDVSFIVCSGNVVFNNVNVGTGPQSFCLANITQSIVYETKPPACGPTNPTQETSAAGDAPVSPVPDCAESASFGIAIVTLRDASIGIHDPTGIPVPGV